MKIMTILGTRPEIIRLSRIIPKLDQVCDHTLVYTGQNYDHTLYTLFFKELGLREPDCDLKCRSESLMKQIGSIFSRCEQVLLDKKPDRLLVLGDTNSALSAFVANRMGIPVYHMEAGNRCYDNRVPEEVNRRVIDHSSDILLPYTERSRNNLLHEGIAGERIFVTGNPIIEVLNHYSTFIDDSQILVKLQVEPGNYFLVTMHRAENVDHPERLNILIDALHRLANKYGIPVLCSLHPRTRSQLAKQGIIIEGEGVRTFEPLGLCDFIHLEKNAKCVLTDSGTVQEECCIFGIPNVTIRDVTERPETIETGSNIISGAEPESVINCVATAFSCTPDWTPPKEYLVYNVSSIVTKIILGYKLK
jgi:UDP-N-acetylglucosamine 2-epimerase (non-hydrolysing)